MAPAHKAHAPAAAPDALVLPLEVVSRVDVNRMLREVAAIDDFLKQAAIRSPGHGAKLPRTSRLLDEFIGANNLNALHEQDRTRMQTFLISVKSKAPVLHMSFAVDPSPSFMQKLMTYLRREIHPLVLVQVGLQPNIGAGCMVRTTNKYFDFSLRQRFKGRRQVLLERLHSVMQEAAPAPTEEPTP